MVFDRDVSPFDKPGLAQSPPERLDEVHAATEILIVDKPNQWHRRLLRRSMTEAESERLSRNLAEVIDDLYRQHAPPRDHERLIQLVQVQIRHAMSLAERSARHDRERPR